jgi:hypothetical protein
MKRIKALLTGSIAAVILSVFVTSATAQNLGTAYNDTWWNPTESGWGVGIAHQQNFIFATFFVYRADGTPYWVTANLQKVGTSGLATTPVVFTGPVYETHGPGYGGAFDPGAVSAQAVGTATFSASDLANATLQYSIKGVSVTKGIQRMYLSTVNYTGQYIGSTSYKTDQCVPSHSQDNGRITSEMGSLNITQSGSSFHMETSDGVDRCAFNGTYFQLGSVGQVAGNYSCTSGEVGTFELNALQWTTVGVTAFMGGQNQYCRFSGFVGGMGSQHYQN